jgi:hypothetical protein
MQIRVDFPPKPSVHAVTRGCSPVKEAHMSKAKKVKEPKPKKEKAPKPTKEPLVVFAFRLSEADRTAIHDAAGPAKATKFVLSAALAAASGDRKAFDALVENRASKK